MEIGEGVWVSPCLCSVDEHPSPPEWLSPLHTFRTDTGALAKNWACTTDPAAHPGMNLDKMHTSHSNQAAPSGRDGHQASLEMIRNPKCLFHERWNNCTC